MIITMNHRKNRYTNKSEDKYKDKDKDKNSLKERERENKLPENRRCEDSRKHNYKIKVIQNFKKENKENAKVNDENIENYKPIKNNFLIKSKENKEIKIENKEAEKEEKIKYFDISRIDNVQIPKDYINIIYYNLLKEEDRGISPRADYDYMKNQKEINEKMRSILVDWIIDVHYKFGFTDETLYMTVSIIDRYLTINQIKRSNFQLLGITALMIACKHEEIDLPKIDDFIYITDNAYVKNEVIKMEEDVLSQLNFEFLYPSPIKFFEYLSLHFNFNKKHHLMGKYLMETFLLDIKNIKYNSSIISCACAYIVMKFFKFPNYYESYDKKFYTLDENKDKYSESNIKECAKDICLFVDNINKTNY
jgi:cyclin B